MWITVLGIAVICITFKMSSHGAEGRVLQLSPRIVVTRSGKVRGIVKTFPGNDLPQVDAFYGLQYASILGGERRFMPPYPPMKRWQGIMVALAFKPVCPQPRPNFDEMEKQLPIGRVERLKRIDTFLGRQAEECLYLNVYVPVRPNARVRLPVILYIHGETYEMGTGNAYDGSVLSAYGNVVVITMNYRLGVLGFLSTEDENAPGNYGLLDQVAALRWIRDNIAYFGGDPDQVTLLGQGYGAAMVNLLLLSPITKGRHLFKRAIIQSGSALGSWAVTADPLRYTIELADKVNCSQYLNKSDQLVQCFKNTPVDVLINQEIKAPKYYSSFGPTVGKNDVLPSTVPDLLGNHQSAFGDCDVLLGVMQNEGFLYFTQKEITDGINEQRRDEIIQTYVRNMYQYHRQEIFEVLLDNYSDNLMELLGDGQFVSPMVQLANFHANYSAQTYFYSFSCPSSMDTVPRWAGEGGVHGDDLTYVFGAPLTDGIDPFTSAFKNSDKMMTKAIMRYWTNFAKSGNPNVPIDQESNHGGMMNNQFADLTWPIFTNSDQDYLYIGVRPEVRHHYRGTKMALWLDLIFNLNQGEDKSNETSSESTGKPETTGEPPGESTGKPPKDESAKPTGKPETTGEPSGERTGEPRPKPSGRPETTGEPPGENSDEKSDKKSGE